MRILATILIAIRRLIAQRWLALATALGLIAAIALSVSIPVYADAVYYRVLQEELAKVGSNPGKKRPSFAFMFRYSGSLYGLKEWEETRKLDDYLSNTAPSQLGLPIRQTVRYAKTDNFRLFPAADVASGVYRSAKDPLEWVNFGFITDFEQHIRILEGVTPPPATANPDDPIEVLVSQRMAERLGIQTGEEYFTFREVKSETSVRTIQMPVKVSGIWEPADPEDEYWFYRLEVFDKQLFVPQATFEGRIASLLNDEVGQLLWYWLADGSKVSSSDVNRLVGAINAIRQQAATLLINTKLEFSPYDALRKYQSESGLLTLLLYTFSIPIIGLLLAFIGLVVGLSVARQRNEIAVLRSRGATVIQIVVIATIEALILVGLAMAVGLPTSAWVARAIGATKSFLNFTLEGDLRVQLTTAALRFGGIAVVVTLLAQVLPSIGASRHTIVSYKQELARTVRPPWWQRAWLDFLLLIPAGYGAYTLRQQGSLFTPGVGLSGDIFDNPLLFLLPALIAVALALVILRLLPLLMSVLAWLAGRTGSVGFLLATRYLARDPSFYTTPLILLISTLALSAFTASLASTLDNHLYDQSYYSVGASARLVELGTNNQMNTPFGAETGGGGETTSAQPTPTPEPAWVFIPVSEHLKVKEIQAATRVGEFSAGLQLQSKWTSVTLFGIDRVDFPKVAYWRNDFSRASLGALMNALAAAPDGLLIERRLMRQFGLRVGDTLQAQISAIGERSEGTFRIVGDFEYFPTWYAEQELTDNEVAGLVIGNLDYIFEQTGGEQPYDVWVKTISTSVDGAIDYVKIMDELRQNEISVFDYDVASQRIASQQRRPERQGLFGVLSVGFLAAALLTVLGFFLYALFSFRRRFIELGTLRAIGLSPGQLTIFLICELAFLIVLGLGAGTLLGAFISQLFIPYLQVGTNKTANTPPFAVEIAWDAIGRLYLLFGGLFFVALAVLIVLLLRMKVFQAIKLGETV